MIELLRTYRYVVQDADRHGNVRVYLRVPGKPKVRLRAQPGTDAFEAEYRAALEAKPAKKGRGKPAVGTVLPGSIDDFCIAYYSSASFKSLAPRSQHVKRLILDKFRDANGTKPAARMERRHFLKIRDDMADRPEAANGLLKALRAVFSVAETNGKIAANPALRVPYLASNNPDGYHTWTVDEVEQFERAHPLGSKAYLALALLLYTGQRRSDIITLGRQHLRDGWISFTQVKGRRRRPVRLSLPVVSELVEAIEACPSTGLTFLESERGGPFQADSFGNRFRKWCRDAGLPHCSAHGLRKAAASRLAERGATAHEIMAITGHRTLKEVQRYTQAAAQRVMAASAMARLSQASAANEKVPPSAGTLKWDNNELEPIDNKGTTKCMVPGAGIEPATLRFSVACSTN